MLDNKSLPDNLKKPEQVDKGNLFCYMYTESNLGTMTPELSKQLLLDECYLEITGKSLNGDLDALGTSPLLTTIETRLKVSPFDMKRGM